MNEYNKTGRPGGRPVSGGGVRGTFELDRRLCPAHIDAVCTREAGTSVNEPHANRASETARYSLSPDSDFASNPDLSDFIIESFAPGGGEAIQRVDIVHVHHLSHPCWHLGDRLSTRTRTFVRIRAGIYETHLRRPCESVSEPIFSPT
jgi:hypothetical protein